MYKSYVIMASAESRHSAPSAPIVCQDSDQTHVAHSIITHSYCIPTPKGSISCELPPDSILGCASPSAALNEDPMTASRITPDGGGGAAAAELASELAEADKPREEDAASVLAGTAVMGSATVGSAGKPW